MQIKLIPLSKLRINQSNDRHGELENETAAISWLFHKREDHMKNLATDIATSGRLYELPLVYPENSNFVVYDGNRRVTCLKLLHDPKKAPTTELQKYFSKLKENLSVKLPNAIRCQVEADRDVIDETLFRRHTGSQKGIGQSKWDDRMQTTFIERTGRGGKVNVADEIEKILKEEHRLPARRKIPRSNLNRLLSSEAFRNRVGISVQRNNFRVTHDHEIVVEALSRIADDLAHGDVVLGDIWDVDGKLSYLDKLEDEGLLPTADQKLPPEKTKQSTKTASKPRTRPTPRPQRRTSLIPNVEYGIAWTGKTQKHHLIWEELQFHLTLNRHPNAVAVLLRVLLEISIDHYIEKASHLSVPEREKLGKKIDKVATDLHQNGKITSGYLKDIRRIQQGQSLISIESMHRYVHSSQFSPATEDLCALWDSVSDLIQHCLNY